MKSKATQYLLAALLGVALAATLHAQTTTFTYQGLLTVNGAPANGSYDLTFSLWDASLGAQQGGTITNVATAVSNGLFTVTLDFGAAVFDGNPRSLEIGVATHGSGAFNVLTPRQPITSSPYAIRAGNATSAATVSGTVAASQLTGTINATQLPATVVTNGASGVNISGTFSGDGSAITNVDLLNVNSQGAITFTTDWGNIVLSSSPVVGTGPQSVAAADVNGDGKMDLISANSGTLSVLTNNGSGGFTLSSSPGVSGGSICVTTADVNGDGKVDLISANNLAHTLSVLTNDGGGGFPLSSTLGVGLFPRSITAADVNGDGKVDLISANSSPNTLSVLTNNGSGGFTFSASPGVGTSPYSVTTADVNGDGKVDLISANRDDATLTVLTNNGSGGFTLSSSPPVGAAPTCVAAADINGDGKADLISANSGLGFGDTLTVLTNNGSGGFVLSSSPVVGPGPIFVAATDINGDSKVDLISANPSDRIGNTLTVLTNNGSGGFVLSSSPVVGVKPSSVTAADINGDGQVDLISANSGANTLSVLLNTPVSITASFNGDGSGLTGTGDNLGNHIATQMLDMAGNAINNAAAISIGTTNLQAGNKLTIVGGHLAVRNDQTIRFERADGTPAASIVPANEGMTLLEDRGGNITSLTVGGADIILSAGNAERLRVLQNGNVGIGTNAPAQKLHVIGNILASGTVTGASDRNVKQDFVPVNPQDVLAKVAGLPISTWQYKSDPEGQRHLGPMAQDFYGAFQVGMDDKHISMVDADGVALAAIQGLNEKLEQKEAEITELKARLEKLEQLLSDKLNGGVR